MSRIHEALKRAEEEKAMAPQAGNDILSVPDQAAQAAGPIASPAEAGIGGEAAAAALRFAPILSAGMLAAVPVKGWKPMPNMLFLNGAGEKQPGMEQFRTLRSRLYHLREHKRLKTLLIGSALPGEGKTFIAANLAQALARQHGRKVLLIDGDLRRPQLHEVFGTMPAPGLTDYLAGKSPVSEIIQRGPMENLYLITSGHEVGNPAELAANGLLKPLVQAAAEVFDWVIFDSAPVVPVSDATIMAAVCDAVMLVVQSSTTPFDLAQRARQEFRPFSIVGAVLNRVEATAGYSRYYDYDGYNGPTKHTSEVEKPN